MINAEPCLLEWDTPKVTAGGDKKGFEVGAAEGAVGDFVVRDRNEIQ